ncbi:hypothetical protein BJ508DRAFT_182190 [Ascobolus immersus RN42]|uniref:Uncharacterized protein n=1 Tax=Ascobolus immersus RN42 TaxID=1160509 RepID=A0A3N4HTH5_ASCIM|nr:hypothetical protein BJ508DRAFT_182190 [Ascobolus immersus RN42]
MPRSIDSFPSPDSSRSSSPSGYPNPLAAAHLLRAQQLLHKVETLQHILRSPKYAAPTSNTLPSPTDEDETKESTWYAAPISQVELRHFHAAVKAEVNLLSFQAHSKPKEDEDPAKAPAGTISGSNLPFLESVWRVVEAEGPGVRGLRVGVGYKEPAAPGNGGKKGKMVKRRVEVDVISDGGRRWTKVLGTTKEKLIRELSLHNHADDLMPEEDEESEEIEHGILRTLKGLVRARGETWVGYLRPVVELRVLGISAEEAEGDGILRTYFRQVRKMGVEVGFGAGGPTEKEQDQSGEGWMEDLHRECSRRTYHFGPPLQPDGARPVAVLDCTVSPPS